MVAGVELTYQTNATAVQMAQTIFGDGVTVVSASYTGDPNSSAIYSNGQLSPGVVPAESGVILSTGQAASFTSVGPNANTSAGTSSNTAGIDGNAQFNAIAGGATFDASWLDVTFVPTGNVMTMRFVFSSEEYPEYSSSTFNDVVGVWINGTHVPLSVANGPTAVGSVNQLENQNLYVSNTGSLFNTEMDGFTVTMTLTIPVNPGVNNSIRIGIADVADSAYDSNLLIAADSVQTTLVAQQDDLTMFTGSTRSFDVLGNDVSTTGGTLVITHINGIAVSPGDSVTLTTGQVVTLNADGTITITTDADLDTVSFTYTTAALDGSGAVLQTDTGFVTVTTVPCFVAGTLIRTPAGEVPVETLRPGDLVLTQDEGPQPLRWIGQRTVAAEGALAPVQIRAGTFGAHGALMVSPQHRILIRDALAELLFGEAEVLVAAKDLINGRSVRQVAGGAVTYVHILFDRHQVVWSEGLATESYLPGPQTASAFDAAVLEEITTLFPALEPRTGRGYGASARRTLRHYEAQVLMTAAA